MKRASFVLAVAAAWCALILLVHRDSPRTLVSAHGLLHAAIAEQVAPERAPPFATPPDDPLFAGERLPYYWFFHAVGAQIASLLGIHVIQAFELMVLAAAFATVLLGFQLGRWFHGDWRAVRVYGPAFALLFFAGCHPQGPLVLLARWFRDGSEALADRGQYLWGLVHPANAAMRIGDYWGALGPLASYFFNVTARPLALASLVLVIVMLGLALDPARPARLLKLVGLALSMTLCTLWSPLIGLASTGALSAALLWEEFGEAFRRRSGRDDVYVGGRLPLAGCAVALAAGALIAAPWWWHLFQSGGPSWSLTFNGTRAVGVVASCWLLLVLVAGENVIRQHRVYLVSTLWWAGWLLAIPTTFIALPVGNEDNFLHAAIVCWCTIAAASIASPPASHQARIESCDDVEGWVRTIDELPPRTRFVVYEQFRFPGFRLTRWLPRTAGRCLLLVHLAFLPTLAIVVFSYTGRPDVPIEFADGAMRRTPAGGPEARLYAWIRESTAPDAVFVQDPGTEGRQCTGNTSELPAFTGRRLFTDYAQHYLVASHADAGRRAELTRRLVLCEALGVDDRRYLERLGVPLYVVTYGADAETLDALERAHGAAAFVTDPIRVHAWRPQP